MLWKIKKCMNNWWEIPDEYMEYLLIKELYHCTPSQLDKQSYEKTKLHFNILMLERKKEYLDSKRAEQKSSLKK